MAVVDKELVERWIFKAEQLENTPSRKTGIDAAREASYRHQAAGLIQDIGQKLQVTQLCINTAIVYMHRFYMFHSFSKFHRSSTSSTCLFLAAKVEEQPRRLEHVIRTWYACQYRDQPPLEVNSEAYLELTQELVSDENILLQTLGFNIMVDHPHSHIVKTCNLVKASKDLAQTSYFLATNSLHLTTMCLQYASTTVACACIHLACKWSSFEIPRSSEGKPWWTYVEPNLTLESLEAITRDFLTTLEKSPNKIRAKLMNLSKGASSGGDEPLSIPSLNNTPHSQSSSFGAPPMFGTAPQPSSSKVKPSPNRSSSTATRPSSSQPSSSTARSGSSQHGSSAVRPGSSQPSNSAARPSSGSTQQDMGLKMGATQESNSAVKPSHQQRPPGSKQPGPPLSQTSSLKSNPAQPGASSYTSAGSHRPTQESTQPIPPEAALAPSDDISAAAASSLRRIKTDSSLTTISHRDYFERKQREKLEREKIEKEKQERDRIEKEKQEKERLEREKIEKERLEKERLEREKLEKEKRERDRLENERREKERLERERLERDRLEKERQERERLEKERQERERLEKERLDKERQERERLEKEKQERLEKVKQERERLERLEKEKQEKDRLERERERLEREKEKLQREKQRRQEKEMQGSGEDGESSTRESLKLKVNLKSSVVERVNGGRSNDSGESSSQRVDRNGGDHSKDISSPATQGGVEPGLKLVLSKDRLSGNYTSGHLGNDSHRKSHHKKRKHSRRDSDRSVAMESSVVSERSKEDSEEEEGEISSSSGDEAEALQAKKRLKSETGDFYSGNSRDSSHHNSSSHRHGSSSSKSHHHHQKHYHNHHSSSSSGGRHGKSRHSSSKGERHSRHSPSPRKHSPSP